MKLIEVKQKLQEEVLAILEEFDISSRNVYPCDEEDYEKMKNSIHKVINENLDKLTTI